ncbi:hypothetical protein L208DRAFT_1419945 [Tricholoma matsutake]|nr:hypothetical protein L208DRAFT_1419945 [Tricholoma matsutake 945]
MRIAKLEIKIIVTLFLSGYDYDIVDAQGKHANHLPSPNYNDIRARPLGDPCYVKFKRIVD